MTAEHSYFAAIREVYVRAGSPSSRSLARQVDISHTHVHQIVSGRTLPKREVLERILLVLMAGDDEGRSKILLLHEQERLADMPSHGVKDSKRIVAGTAYLVLTDGELHDVVINDEPMAVKVAKAEKAVLVQLPIMYDFRERE